MYLRNEREQFESIAAKNAVGKKLNSFTAHEIKKGMTCGEFKAYFQPQISLDSGAIYGCEVLARWEHPEYGLLPPSAFLESVELYGLMDELFFIMLEQGLDYWHLLRGSGVNIKLGINLHPKQLGSGRILECVQECIELYDVPASALTFELTEASKLSRDNVLIFLRNLGCGLSIDDVGTGYSSLQRLCELPATEIKIDAKFVSLMGNNVAYETVVRAIASLAKELGVICVAEGVESARQYRQLLSMGVAVVQGYWFSKPLPGDEVLKFISRSHPQIFYFDKQEGAKVAGCL
jgi:EAL domain-containing protein (putative c-di-GMP-specific phosphodiesterase class I)